MELVIVKKDVQGRNLQHHEEYKIKVPPDEEKNITHLQNFLKHITNTGPNACKSMLKLKITNALQMDSDHNSSMPGRFRVQRFLKDHQPRAPVI